MTCVPGKDSAQPGHPFSLIRVFACSVWEAKDPIFLQNSEDSNQTMLVPRLMDFQVIFLILSCSGSNISVKVFVQPYNKLSTAIYNFPNVGDALYN